MPGRKSLFYLIFLLPLTGISQVVQQRNAAEIRQELAALQVSGRVLYVAAHPDDENTRLLAYLAKERKVKTGYLSLTRGDGGQNLIGTEQAELLGLIRTQELLAARGTDGAEQFFSTANDFGFSKTSAEALKIWDHEKILGNAVWVIRSFRPDVIITRFPEDERAGHGHHSASAIIAREAFVAAADPKRFPEQLAHVKTWKAKRLFWNTSRFGSNNTTAEDQLKIDVGGYNQLLGKSYGEIAAESRTKHKSQGFGSAGQRGTAMEYFVWMAGEPAKTDILEGVDLSLKRNGIKEQEQSLLANIIAAFNPADPAASIPALLKLREGLKGLDFKHDLLDELILDCAGVFIRARVAEPTYAVDSQIPVNLEAIMRADLPSGLQLSLKLSDGREFPLTSGKAVHMDWQVAAQKFGISQPYWLREKHPLGSYLVTSYAELGMPELPGPGTGIMKIKIGAQEIAISRPLVFTETDPVKGELVNPVVIAAPVTATLDAASYLFLNGSGKKIRIKLQNFGHAITGQLRLKLPQGWKAEQELIPFTFQHKAEVRDIEVNITPEKGSKDGVIAVSVICAGQEYNLSYREISYAHIPVLSLFPAAEARLQQAQLNYGGKRIAYIAGAGDLIPQSLQQIGYQVTQLTPNQILTNDLSVYDAIITGVRLYNISNEIQQMQGRLLTYVEQGGNLLVQYNVNAPLKLASIGPYPMKLGRGRVTEEDAAVKFLKPEHPVLNYPNQISSADFEGWIQERGLYFANDYDPRYEAIFSMHDRGEAPADGSLLIANYGKGKFVYTGLAFFRELPAGVPGAYRLFVNLISANQVQNDTKK